MLSTRAKFETNFFLLKCQSFITQSEALLHDIDVGLFLSRLIIGYVLHPDGRSESVSSTDIELYAAGEDGNDPTDWGFSFVAGKIISHLNIIKLLG